VHVPARSLEAGVDVSARWKTERSGHGEICSECGWNYPKDYCPNYCPNCGTPERGWLVQSVRRQRERADAGFLSPPGDRDLTLYFSEVNGETCAGPWHFPPNLRVKTLQQRLEDETFSSRCFDKHTDERLAIVEILTSCGVVLDSSHYLIECPVRDGDTLTVVMVDCDDQEIRSESPGEVMVP